MKTKLFTVTINEKDTDYIDANKDDLIERLFMSNILEEELAQNNILVIKIVELEVKKKNG